MSAGNDSHPPDPPPSQPPPGMTREEADRLAAGLRASWEDLTDEATAQLEQEEGPEEGPHTAAPGDSALPGDGSDAPPGVPPEAPLPSVIVDEQLTAEAEQAEHGSDPPPSRRSTPPRAPDADPDPIGPVLPPTRAPARRPVLLIGVSIAAVAVAVGLALAPAGHPDVADASEPLAAGGEAAGDGADEQDLSAGTAPAPGADDEGVAAAPPTDRDPVPPGSGADQATSEAATAGSDGSGSAPRPEEEPKEAPASNPPTATPRPAAAPAPSERRASTRRRTGPSDTIRVRIRTRPADAKLRLDGTAVANPFDARLTRDGRAHRVEAAAPGYQPAREALRFDRDRAAVLRLRPVRRRSAPPRSKTGSGSGSTSSSSSGAGFVTENPY